MYLDEAAALFAFILSRVARYTPSYSIKNRSNNPQKSLAANFYELLIKQGAALWESRLEYYLTNYY